MAKEVCGKEKYVGREIHDSMLGVILRSGEQKRRISHLVNSDDDELLDYLEREGESLIGYYNEILRQTDSEEDELEYKSDDNKTGREGTELHSYLSTERQLEIARQVVGDIPEVDRWRSEVEARENQERKERKIDKTKPQWRTVATTPPTHFEYVSKAERDQKIKELEHLGINYSISEDNDTELTIYGSRISFAFWKPVCQYRSENKKGCRYCALSSQNRLAGEVSREDQLASLDYALEFGKQGDESGIKNTVIEILPDGSFLNNNEVPEETRLAMMKRISKEKAIQRVAIETRPEHCNADKVSQLIRELNPPETKFPKKLNIYLGLETTDDFVSAVVNRKGYGFAHFKRAIKDLLADLTDEEKSLLELSVYNIIKPSYLTEQEAILLAERMAEEIDEFSQEVDFPISIKYEPSVISAGTNQDYLFRQKDERGDRRFKPLSYFSVAELIARLVEKNLHSYAKFGQRDDIDFYTVVSMVTRPDDDTTFSQFDYMVYNAVQRFNTDHDVRGFLVDMKIPIDHSEESRLWEKDFYGGEGLSALSRLTKNNFVEQPISDEEEKRTDFQRAIWQVADDIEYNSAFSENLRKNARDHEDEIEDKIKKMFYEKGNRMFGRPIVVLAIRGFTLVDSGDIKNEGSIIGVSDVGQVNPAFHLNSAKAAYQTEVIVINEQGQPQSVWVKIPLVLTNEPEKPGYIYGVTS